MPSFLFFFFFFFYVCVVRFASNLCEGKPKEVLSFFFFLCRRFFWITTKTRREREVNDETREVRVKKSCFCTRKQGSQCETKAKGKILMRSREKKERRVSVERKKIDERREAKNFGFKNKKFKKEDTSWSRLVGLVVECRRCCLRVLYAR